MSELPSRRGKRPSALDVSFGIDPDDSSASDASSRKRDRGDAGDAGSLRGAKRRNLDENPRPKRKYEPRPYEQKETGETLLFGEDQYPPDDGRKRTRRLSKFTFFDGHNENLNTMVSLDVLDNNDHHVLGAGVAVAVFDIDEDDAQEDDVEGYGMEQYIRTSRIRKYFTKYWESDSPFFVETDHAIYELDVQSIHKKYRSQFRPFWKLQTILKFVISSAANDAEQEYSGFIRAYSQIKIFGEPLEERELWEAVPKLKRTLERVPRGDDLRASNVIRHLLSRMAPILPIGSRKMAQKQSVKVDRLSIEYKGNLDLAVLRDSIRTHVTPRIVQMAENLFKETLYVVGPKPPPEPEVPQDKLALRLRGFLERTQTRRRVQFRPDQRIGRSRWLKHIVIDGVKYETGDTVIFYPGNGIPPDPDDLPPTDTLANHFWFARLISIHEGDETVHVQWFEHSSKTLLQELGKAQELFLTNQCDTQALKHIIGSVTTHYIKPGQSLADVQPCDYFYRYLWDDYNGTYTDVHVDALAAFAREPPPNNCPACDIAKKFDEGTEATKIHLGIRWHGVEYHYDDCVFIKADDKPCHIGQIIDFDLHSGEVVVRLFGRTDRVGSRPDTTLKDERHLFCTDDEPEKRISIRDLIGVCYVVVKEDMPELDTWLAMSPRRFYVKYRFPRLNVTSWASKRRMRWDDLPICPTCVKQDFKKFKGMKTFLEREAPLRTFDPFGGTGAFSLAMEEMGCFKLTHAVEIVPSTAETLRKNASRDIKVYNQCSNKVLEYAILTHENKSPEPLRSIGDNKQLPPPPKPGDIDCITAGFPCQAHSTLNMYHRAEDSKSNLILTLLSFVDFLKPRYCIFENVRGFLQFNLRAHQQNEYSVKGGIPMGGLKLVATALLDMGYQFRCALLQAGHYGTPQRRVRFFMIAAKRGLELPAFPQPTHDFPVTESLDIKFPDEIILKPITTLRGVAPHRDVTVRDAISDLPRFHWKHPKKVYNRRQMEEQRIKECRDDRPWCGFQGRDVAYEHEPCTTFQKKCRSRPTNDIQQYTRTYDAKKVERVVEIPIRPDADYRDLRPDLWEWQLVNPASSVARSNFRSGFYGRVDMDKCFQATVTNVDPTAKQSRVLHPENRRILTVRELARSQGFPDHYVFYARDDRVMTMHRQIGNAVPWPVSTAIAREFRESLYKTWAKTNPIPDEPADEDFSDDDAASTNGGAMEIN